jgi:hypothetical protein
MEDKLLSNLEINQLIAKKASENEEFKLALLNDPKAAIEKEFKVTFPEDIKVEVHVESSKVLHLIIPAANTDELTDDQLEDVAGGVAAFNPGGAVMAYGVQIPGGNGWRWPKY